jgi:hypothetical protein
MRNLLCGAIAALALLWHSEMAGVVGTPDLTISTTHSSTFTGGQVGVPYALTVSSLVGPSAGPTSGTVTVTDALPTGLTATSLFGPGWSCDVGMLTCTRSDSLSPGNAYPPITLIVNVAQDAPCLVTNTATVTGGGDATPGNDSASDPTPVVDDQTPAVTPPGSETSTQTLCQ